MPGSHKRTPKWKKGHPARAGQEKEEHSLKINTLILNHFMLFENAEFNWSKNINIICGENSTGKTTLLKVMYSILKPLGKGHKEAVTKKKKKKMFVDKLQGVFRPDGMKIGRMVTRKQGSNRTDFSVLLEKNQRISIGFGNRQENHADISMEQLKTSGDFDVIYILLRVLEIKVFKNAVSSYDLLRFMRDFRGVRNREGTYTNISRDQAVNEKIRELTGMVNLDALYLSEKEVENLFRNCMLIGS